MPLCVPPRAVVDVDVVTLRCGEGTETARLDRAERVCSLEHNGTGLVCALHRRAYAKSVVCREDGADIEQRQRGDIGVTLRCREGADGVRWLQGRQALCRLSLCMCANMQGVGQVNGLEEADKVADRGETSSRQGEEAVEVHMLSTWADLQDGRCACPCARAIQSSPSGEYG